MRFTYCPHCGSKLTQKEFCISGEVDSANWVKFENALGLLREGSSAWQLVKAVIEK